MKSDPIVDIREDRTTVGPLTGPLMTVLLAIGLLGLLLAAGVGWMSEGGWQHFFHSYLMNFCFFLSIALGALFFVAVQHVSHAGWSVTVRRLAEILAGTLPYLAVLFLPILVPVLMWNTELYERLFGSAELYPWLDAAFVAAGPAALQTKTQYYLNIPFFLVRCIGYFAVWALISRYFLSRSRRQDDTGEPELSTRMAHWSAPALVLFAVTVSFASFDLLMSLDPMWFSSIYGVYFFAGAVVAGLSAIIVLAMALQSSGWLASSITADHYHELGKLLLGFIVFWGYIGFSQYMLIWYANIPEETVWFLHRQTGPWVWITLALLFGHLLIPFFGLLPRTVKRERTVLAAWSVWMLIMHWLDLYWLVMPSLSPDRLPFGLIDVGCLVGLFALYLAAVLQLAGNRSLVPLKDPRLPEALGYHNA